jgi:hypothetical protein
MVRIEEKNQQEEERGSLHEHTIFDFFFFTSFAGMSEIGKILTLQP